MSETLKRIHAVVKAYAIIFVFWGLYRVVFRFPEEIEETFLKPLIFIGAVMFTERPQNLLKYFADVWGSTGWMKALGSGFGVGALYVLFYACSNFLAFGKLRFGNDLTSDMWFSLLVVGTLTAIWEEWVFSGYILRQLTAVFKDNVWGARITTALLFSLVHLPILVFWYRYTPSVTIFQLVLLFILGAGNAVLMGFSKNLLAPVISHVLWGVAIFLFQ